MRKELLEEIFKVFGIQAKFDRNQKFVFAPAKDTGKEQEDKLTAAKYLTFSNNIGKLFSRPNFGVSQWDIDLTNENAETVGKIRVVQDSKGQITIHLINNIALSDTETQEILFNEKYYKPIQTLYEREHAPRVSEDTIDLSSRELHEGGQESLSAQEAKAPQDLGQKRFDMYVRILQKGIEFLQKPASAKLEAALQQLRKNKNQSLELFSLESGICQESCRLRF